MRTNKAATAILNGEDKGAIEADTWTSLTLSDEAGIHILRLYDSNTGDMIFTNFAVNPKDRVAPVITLASSTILVLEGSSPESMDNAIKEGISILDNNDGEITAYTVTGAPESTEAGLYSLTYTAQDEAGNISTAYRTLYIMKEGTPLVKVNGEAALPYGRTVLGEKDITLEITGTDSNVEVIKWKSGMKTTAQMKHSASTVVDNAFTVPEKGFYTIYVRTRDRVEYVTYLYVED